MNDFILCVDCDETLVKTDLLYEAFLLAIKENVLNGFKVLFWLFRGKTNLKVKLAEIVQFDWDTIPINKDILNYIEAAKENRRVSIVSASPRTWINSLADYLGIFDEVHATDEHNGNLSGKRKAAFLRELYGEKGFEYMGNGKSDMPVWEVSAKACVVSRDKGLIKKVQKLGIPSEVMTIDKSGFFTYLKAIRVYQWMKNALVFIPLLAGHRVSDISACMNALLAFFAFSFCASTGYVINDLMDLSADRLHPRKHNRPFASCKIKVLYGILLIPFLLLIAVLMALSVDKSLLIVVLLYFAMTLSYSLFLKKQVIVDVVFLAGLYTMRILAGAVATQIVPSFWLLAFAAFFFMSLAMIKRYSEMILVLDKNKTEAAGRGYCTEDLPVLRSLGTSTGIGSILIFALYINNPATAQLYPNTYVLWVLPFMLLYWVSRVWMKAHRKEVHDDPLIFAVKDWQSRVILVISFVIFLIAADFVKI